MNAQNCQVAITIQYVTLSDFENKGNSNNIYIRQGNVIIYNSILDFFNAHFNFKNIFENESTLKKKK